MQIRRPYSSYERMKVDFPWRLLYQALPEIVGPVNASPLARPQYAKAASCQIRGSAFLAIIDLSCSLLLPAGPRR